MIEWKTFEMTYRWFRYDNRIFYVFPWGVRLVGARVGKVMCPVHITTSPRSRGRNETAENCRLPEQRFDWLREHKK